VFGHWPVYLTPCKATAKKFFLFLHPRSAKNGGTCSKNGRTLSDYGRSHHGTEKPASRTK
jgi:hypothetical protein